MPCTEVRVFPVSLYALEVRCLLLWYFCESAPVAEVHCIHAFMQPVSQLITYVGRRRCIFVILAAVSLASVSVLGRLGFNFNSIETPTDHEMENLSLEQYPYFLSNGSVLPIKMICGPQSSAGELFSGVRATSTSSRSFKYTTLLCYAAFLAGRVSCEDSWHAVSVYHQATADHESNTACRPRRKNPQTG